MQYLSEMPSAADPDPEGGVEPLPPSIQILIVLFALFGAGALYDVLHAMATDRISINFGVLQLFIAWGLFKRRNFWRGAGQAWIGLGIAAVLIFMLVTVVSPESVRTRVADGRYEQASPLVALALELLVLGCALSGRTGSSGAMIT